MEGNPELLLPGLICNAEEAADDTGFIIADIVSQSHAQIRHYDDPPAKKTKFSLPSDQYCMTDLDSQTVAKLLDELSDDNDSGSSSGSEEEAEDVTTCQSAMILADNTLMQLLNPLSEREMTNSSNHDVPCALPEVDTSQTTADTKFVWSESPPQPHAVYPFTGDQSLKQIPCGSDPRHFFDLVFSEELFAIIVRETNSVAHEVFLKQGGYDRSRIGEWKDTTIEEMKMFIGLLFYTGVVPLNRVRDYWKRDEKFDIQFISSRLSRDRFMVLLQSLHFAPNPPKGVVPDDPLYKIRPLISYFCERMVNIKDPGKNICIDESMAPWRGRLSFRQYLPLKSHKYGVKLYMLTEPDGLIYRFVVYAGSRDKDVSGLGHASKVVFKLTEGFRGEGRSLYMDNYYNSIELAANLLKEKTYVTGTLRSIRKYNPSEVTNAKLKKGQLIQRWSEEGINVCKWKDKRDVLVISSEYSGDFVKVKKGKTDKIKPNSIAHYNKNMGGIDRVDQLISYFTSPRRSVKW